MTEKNNPQKGQERTAALEQFLILEGSIKSAVISKNKDAIETARQNLMLFFNQLDSEQKLYIKEFAEQENALARIEGMRGSVHKSMNSLMSSIGTVIEATASTVPKVIEESTRLIVSSVLGITKGVYRSFSQSA